MLDEHIHPDNWGVKPILFRLLGINIYSYEFFVLLGLIVAVLIYVYEARKEKFNSEKSIYIALAAFTGGVIGAKLLVVVLHFNDIVHNVSDISVVLSGRSVVGGFIGGIIGVNIAKRILKIQTRRGNLFALAAPVGIAIGRIGCFLRGCCYGISTSLPWGVDFGDGINRHPTQLYEGIFMAIIALVVYFMKRHNPKPGQLFDILIITYFSFRFVLEFIKYEEVEYFGLTIYQILAILVLSRYVIRLIKYKRLFV